MAFRKCAHCKIEKEEVEENFRWIKSPKSRGKIRKSKWIPQSKFKYTSMSDDSFKECWSLSNLRPLSAKKNITEQHLRFK